MLHAGSMQERGAALQLPLNLEGRVGRLAQNEYADELVVVAVAIELKIRIVCVPFTPPAASGLWKISTYQDSEGGAPREPTVYMGNNDVHYMWLSRLAA